MATLLEEEGDIVANSNPFATVFLNSHNSKDVRVHEVVEDSNELHAAVDNLTGEAMQHVSTVQLSTLLLNPKTKVAQSEEVFEDGYDEEEEYYEDEGEQYGESH